jgi:flagellar basal body-associated protein FliL
VKKKLAKKLDKFHKKRSKLVTIVLISVIVILALALGYDMYTLFQTKIDAEATQSALNENILLVTQERDQLVIERNNLIVELDTLNQTMINLNNQRKQLIAESNSLTSDLDNLQTKYNALVTKLDETEEDLNACLAATP